MKSYILVLSVDDHKKSKIAWEVFLYSFAKRPLTSDANFLVNDHDLLRFSYFSPPVTRKTRMSVKEALT